MCSTVNGGVQRLDPVAQALQLGSLCRKYTAFINDTITTIIRSKSINCNKETVPLWVIHYGSVMMAPG